MQPFRIEKKKQFANLLCGSTDGYRGDEILHALFDFGNIFQRDDFLFFFCLFVSFLKAKTNTQSCYLSFNTKYIGVETNVVLRNVQSSMQKNLFVKCRRES